MDPTHTHPSPTPPASPFPRWAPHLLFLAFLLALLFALEVGARFVVSIGDDPVLKRVVEALTSLKRDERVKLVLGREPLPLYRFLEKNGYQYLVSPQDAGIYEILIWESGRK